MRFCGRCRKGSEDIVGRLLNTGAKSSVGDTNRRALTPLAEAIINGHVRAAEVLIDQVIQGPGGAA